jgi:hypothetical protein
VPTFHSGRPLRLGFDQEAQIVSAQNFMFGFQSFVFCLCGFHFAL